MEIHSTRLISTVVQAAISHLVKKRNIGDIVEDIRFLRFNDEGVLSLIDLVVAGTQGACEQLLKRLVEFNDHEWEVARRLEQLSHKIPQISELTHQELQLISWQKPNIRREIQEILNVPNGGKIDVKKLAGVRDGIRDLNRAIDDLEDRLLHGKK